MTMKGRRNTRLAHAGHDPRSFHGFVNPPVVRASTVLFGSADEMLGRASTRYSYGLTNTPTIEALVTAIDELEGAAGTVLVPSGLAAVTIAILTAVTPGQTILVPDNVYWPTRRFCDGTLRRMGVETVYYDPLESAGISDLVDERTTAIFIEAPGSQTFEMPDIPAIVRAAKAVGAATMMDNTWATPLLYRPLENDIDFSIQAGTKYYGGHSDLLIGSVSANETWWRPLARTHRDLGLQAGTEEIYLTLRGMRTMGVRLERHAQSAMTLAHWLEGRDEVDRVLHPALPGDPGHAIWKRDFDGASGLFGFVLNGTSNQAGQFLDALELFGLGYSWGGFESLAVLAELDGRRTAKPWSGGPVIRLQVGLEDPEDLIEDLERAFAVSMAS